MQFRLLPFEQLTVHQLFEIYKLRSQVFVVEQDCPYQDPDDKDLKAYHLCMLQNDQLIGYARLLPAGVSYNEPSIGRVVVSPNNRRGGAGRALMQQCLLQMEYLFDKQPIVISAQSYLLQFYTSLGFVAEGGEYLEDNIPHQQMRYIFST